MPGAKQLRDPGPATASPCASSGGERMAGPEVRIFQALHLIPWVQGLVVVAVGGIWAPALTRESRLSLAD